MEEQNQLDKRPWLMDWLFEIGHNMAIINHCYEKIQYLNTDLENDNGDPEKLVDKLNHYHEIRELAYQAYDIEMTHLFNAIPSAQKDCRCLLKHASTALVMAQETADSLNNEIGDENLKKVFEIFAGVVAVAFDIEFKTCMRCLYDGIKNVADGNKNTPDFGKGSGKKVTKI